jgi:hypothetical protein
MVATESEAPVIATATVAGVGKQDVLIFVVADPLAATLGSRKLLGTAAQATAASTALLCSART